jgi:hypothetical protein
MKAFFPRLLLVGSLVGAPVVGNAEFTERDAAAFQDFLAGQSYEGDVLPPLANPGWNAQVANTAGDPVVTLNDGVLRYFVPGNGSFIAWNQPAIVDFGNASVDRGWTTEIRARILHPDEVEPLPPSRTNFMHLDAYRIGDTMGTYVLRLWDTEVEWQETPSRIERWRFDNAEEFNVFRLVKEPNSGFFQLYRNGEHIGVNLSGGTVPTQDRFLWGDWSTTLKGAADVDYVRWDMTGAYVPPGVSWNSLPNRASDDLSGKYEAEVLPQDAVPAWSRLWGTQGGAPTHTVADGILTFTTPAANSFVAWRNDDIIRQATSAGGWTIEMKVRIHADPPVAPPIERLHLLVNQYVPGDPQGAYHLVVWNDAIQWTYGSTVLEWPMDNTQKFHNFRLVKEPAGGTYRIYRDNVEIARDLTGNGNPIGASAARFLWGDWATTRQGGAEVDYVRWDFSGPYIPVGAVAPAGYAGWVKEHFNAADQADPLVAGPAADPAGDGVANLLKYALGLSPWTSARSSLPVPAVQEIGSDRYLTLTFSRPSDRADVILAVESSGGLQWNGEAVLLSSVEENGVVTETYRDSVPVAEAGRRFLRLRLEAQE